jgi:GAF domain-containing protein
MLQGRALVGVTVAPGRMFRRGAAMDFERDIAKVSGIAAVSTILDVVSRTTGMGFTAVARVTEDRWITCASRDELAFGLKPGDELKVETTICHEIRQSREAVVIENVSEDAGYFKHHTPAQYGFQSYISVPIILPDGSFFGTLCAIDPKPRKLRTPEVIGMFKLFAELIASHLDAGDRVELIENRLALERQNAELREQFIAVLGHDLRNPLAAIQGGLRLLNKKVDEEGQNWINLLQGSVARMAGLIDNVMDLARTRLGAGMQLELREQALEPVIKQIVAEFENVHPDRVIETVINIPGTVRIDAGRIGQMLSNLLGNAISYGANDRSWLRHQHCQQRCANSGGGDAAPFHCVRSWRRSAEPERAWARTVHCPGDRARPWRVDRRVVVAG